LITITEQDKYMWKGCTEAWIKAHCLVALHCLPNTPHTPRLATKAPQHLVAIDISRDIPHVSYRRTSDLGVGIFKSYLGDSNVQSGLRTVLLLL
jgi:hypothetical protein